MVGSAVRYISSARSRLSVSNARQFIRQNGSIGDDFFLVHSPTTSRARLLAITVVAAVMFLMVTVAVISVYHSVWKQQMNSSQEERRALRDNVDKREDGIDAEENADTLNEEK